ncbi:MAG: phosphotransferase family protein [Steroidobacteraceae bacterium]
MPNSTQDPFVAWIQQRLPDAHDIQVTPFRAASSGQSNETKLFDLTYRMPELKTEGLVLRRAPGGRGLFPEYDLDMQVGVMRALAATRVPVPVVRWYEPDNAVLGAPFVVMEFIDGAIPSDLPPGFHGHGLFFDAPIERRQTMWYAVMQRMVELHALNWRVLGLPQLPGIGDTMQESMASHLALFERWLKWADLGALPLIEQGLQWLRDTPPQASRLSLLWGDARPGNVIFREHRAVAVLDWELATIGRPEFDLFYLIYQAEVTAERDGQPRRAGMPDRNDTLKKYSQLAGRKLEDLVHAEMFALVRLAVMIALGVRAAINDRQSRAYLEDNVVMRSLRSLLAMAATQRRST